MSILTALRRLFNEPEYLPTRHFVYTRFGLTVVTPLGANTYSIRHPRVAHTFVTNSSSITDALTKAEAWFNTLADEFGGSFRRQGETR